MFNFRFAVSNIATFFLAMVPVFNSCPPCPICVPKYAAVLALFGLKFGDYSAYLMPVMIISMFLTLRTLYLNLLSRGQSLALFYTAAVACVVMVVFKYIFDNEILVALSLITLAACLVWHAIPARKTCCQ